MNRHLVSWAIVAFAAAGCDDKPAAPTAPSATATGSAAVKSVAAGASATATVAPTGDPGAYGRFHAVAQGEAITLYPLGEAAIVDTGAFYGVLGDGPLEQDPQLFRASVDKGNGVVNITAAQRFDRFFGGYPDQPWAMGPGLMKRVNDVWTAQTILREGETLLDLVPWERKRAIAAIRMAEPDLRFTLAGSSAGGVVPAPGKPTPEQEGCAVRMDPAGEIKLAGLSTGHLFAVGRECKTGKTIAERWAPGKVRGEVGVIEGASDKPTAIAAVSADEVYAMFADGIVALWDGKGWTTQKAPFGAATSAFASSDGAAWALSDTGLYVHPKGGAWAKVEAGAGKITSAWAKDEKTVWAVVDGKTLLRSGPGTSAPIKLPPASEVSTLVERDKRWPATAACKRVYVMIATVAASGDKAPTTYPLLSEAVKGDSDLRAKEIQYLVEDVGGTLYAGAKVPSLAVAEKLAAAVKKQNDKIKPMLVCHEPALVKGALKVE